MEIAMSQELAVQGSRTITINLPVQKEIEDKAEGVLATVEAMEIDSDGMLMIAADELRALKGSHKYLEEMRVFHVGPLNDEVKYINNYFRTALETMEKAERELKTKMLGYQTEQDEARRAEQARFEAEQRAERARIAAEIAARERVAKEEAARLEAERDAALQREREAQENARRLQEERDEAIRSGDEARAKESARLQAEAEAAAERERQAAIQAETDSQATVAAAAEQNNAAEITAIVMTAPVISIAPELKGISTRANYKGRVTDLFALVCYIAKHPEHINLVKANDTAINAIAKAQRDACKVEGITVFEDKTIAARR
jgi:DNA polymerase III alpha subunit (gram-positive type)